MGLLNRNARRRARCTPGRANRRALEAFAFEQIDGRRQVGFGFANLASSRERLEEALVRPLIERRELEPRVEVHERLVIRAAHDELLEHRQCDSCEADDAVRSARR